MKTVKIGDREIGEGQPCYVIAEIGINHNGDVNLARRLIEVSQHAGAQAVKFQKRTIEIVYTPEPSSSVERETPFGTTNGDLKRHLELDDGRVPRDRSRLRRAREFMWFASCWDEPSVELHRALRPAGLQGRVGASLTDHALLRKKR